ncbi:PfkB family carbohydrate kinase [Acuticoccus kandeliae]|uniref:PfkB family carbohydrate kinase n=1 Tax=Acuticoccus kandeliae TaxID=2073160 RepID=UPI0014750705|nr:PfkB family carbohydrate kinase [Acuticoccus kandeliae]
MIVTCGEALVDLMPERMDGTILYRPVLGGSLYNVALGIARLGGQAGYLWELSNDSLGQDLLRALAVENVVTAAVRLTDRATPVAVVDLSGEEPRYNIADPDRVMNEMAPPAVPNGATCLVIGSAVLSREPVAHAIEALAATAPLVAIDYNVRPPSIHDLAGYRARLLRLSRRAGIAKASLADLEILGEKDPVAYMRDLVGSGAGLAVLTAGKDGAFAWTAAGESHVPARLGPIVDAVGAGDAFMCGLLAMLQKDGSLSYERLRHLDGETLKDLLAYAQSVAAVTCRSKGAVMPRAADISAGDQAALAADGAVA